MEHFKEHQSTGTAALYSEDKNVLDVSRCGWRAGGIPIAPGMCLLLNVRVFVNPHSKQHLKGQNAARSSV